MTSLPSALYLKSMEIRAFGPEVIPPASKPLRILLVEDNALHILLTRTILKKAGHAVTVALNGEEAIHRLGRHDYDVILMDIQMPVMDGIEATRRIRSGEAGDAKRTIPIIATTAHGMSGDVEKYRTAGMDDSIIKPIDIKLLMEKLAELARSRGNVL